MTKFIAFAAVCAVLYLYLAPDNSMEICMQKYSYDTCFHSLNR